MSEQDPAEVIQKLLAAPFPEKDILWRIAQSGKNGDKIWAKCLAYIDARHIMDRLDEVVGLSCWQDKYRRDGQSVICTLSLYTPHLGWIEKEDASEESDIEAVKGGISGAFKRAGVKWGIGRYLYKLDESWATVVNQESDGAIYQAAKKDKQGNVVFPSFYWTCPRLPEWALPENERQRPGKPSPDKVPSRPKAPAAPYDDTPPPSEPPPGMNMAEEFPEDSLPDFGTAPAQKGSGVKPYDYEIASGKYKGKKLSEFTRDQTFKYIETMKYMANKDNKAPTRFCIDLERAAKRFYDGVQ